MRTRPDLKEKDLRAGLGFVISIPEVNLLRQLFLLPPELYAPLKKCLIPTASSADSLLCTQTRMYRDRKRDGERGVLLFDGN